MNKPFVHALAVIAFAAGAALAQPASVDLSGTWEISGKASSKPRTLVIKQTGDEVMMQEDFEHEGKLISNTTKLYGDKRGERNILMIPGADSEIEVVSKTEWKKGKLVRRLTMQVQSAFRGERLIQERKETHTYVLSKDGDALTIETSWFSTSPFDSSARPGVGKRTYTRKKG